MQEPYTESELVEWERYLRILPRNELAYRMTRYAFDDGVTLPPQGKAQILELGLRILGEDDVK